MKDNKQMESICTCRVVVGSESGKPFAPREIKTDWNSRVVTIQFGGKKSVLDFNKNQK